MEINRQDFGQRHIPLQQVKRGRRKDEGQVTLPVPNLPNALCVFTELALLYLGVGAGPDAHAETRCVRRQHIGTQVDDDGPCWVKPLQGALGAAQVDLFHVTAVRLVAQTTADKKGRWISLLKGRSPNCKNDHLRCNWKKCGSSLCFPI